MGKREDARPARRTKKHKHHKAEKRRKPATSPPPTLQSEENTSLETEETDIPVVEHEEEIICDGEDIDVEIAEEEVSTTTTTSTSGIIHAASLSSTPNTPPKASRSGVLKKSATKLNTSVASTSQQAAALNPASTAKKSKRKRGDSGTSSEEERWLTAIESGKLEDVVDDELKKMKDPKLMTARQRAMYERNLDKEPSPGGELLMSLPTGYREKEKPQTAEDIQKAALKSQKRKQMADEKREKDKKKTMERLLKKQENKQRTAARNKPSKTVTPMISYRNTLEGAYVQMPPEHKFPLKAQVARAPPKRQLCGIAGCGQPKVYQCSKTNLPLCSFACYRKNVQAIRQIMC